MMDSFFSMGPTKAEMADSAARMSIRALLSPLPCSSMLSFMT